MLELSLVRAETAEMESSSHSLNREVPEDTRCGMSLKMPS